MAGTLEKRDGLVVEALPGLSFKVVLDPLQADAPREEVLAHLAGKMKIHRIRVLQGDRVSVELAPDGRRGRIVRRL